MTFVIQFSEDLLCLNAQRCVSSLGILFLFNVRWLVLPPHNITPKIVLFLLFHKTLNSAVSVVK